MYGQWPRIQTRRLIEATLKPLNANVEVHCVINGIVHVVRRDAADGSVQLKVGDGPFEKVREAAIQSLLPIQAYSQKQLSSVAIRVDELLRFVTSPIQGALDDIARGQSEVAGRLRENYGTLQRYRTLSAEIERSELPARSIGEQAQALRDGLTGSQTRTVRPSTTRRATTMCAPRSRRGASTHRAPMRE